MFKIWPDQISQSSTQSVPLYESLQCFYGIKEKITKILSIDAWAGYEPNTWEWNNWFHVGDIDKKAFEKLTTDQKTTNRKILKYFRNKGYLNSTSQGLCGVEDHDEYNVVITDRKNGRPLYAIEYGPEY